MFWTSKDKKLNTKLMKEIPISSIYIQNTYNLYNHTKNEQELYNNIEKIYNEVLNRTNKLLENLHLDKQKIVNIQQTITSSMRDITNHYLLKPIQALQTPLKLEQTWYKYIIQIIDEIHIEILVKG